MDAPAPLGLAGAFAAGRFALTAETTPPLSADPEHLLARVRPLLGLADAVNVTDGAGARAHMAGLAAARLMVEAGFAPILQLTGRDRNALALARDLIGAAALGVEAVLCLSGDPIEKGDAPHATAVTDLDSVGLIRLAAQLRDDAILPSGRPLAAAPRYLIGAADSPVEPGEGWRPASLLRKVEAGLDFVQTQFCFDLGLFARYRARLREAGVPDRIRFLLGLAPLASARQGRWIRENLPGSIVPDAVLARLEAAADPKREGRAICLELVQEAWKSGCADGAHLMGPGVEAEAAAVIQAARSAISRGLSRV